MKPRLISMLLTGLALAVGLLVAVQISQNIRSSHQNENIDVATGEVRDLNKSIDPIIFKSVTELDGKLILSGTGPSDTELTIEGVSGSLGSFMTDNEGNWTSELLVQSNETLRFEIVSRNSDSVRIRSDETVFRIPHSIELGGASRHEPALIMIAAAGGPTRILQSPFRGMPTSGALGFGPIDYDESGGVIFSGVSELAGRIRFFANDVMIGETRSEADGRWFFIASETLPRGSYDIRAQLLINDAVNSEIVLPFKRLSAASGITYKDNPVYVEYSPFRWQILRNLYGGGYQYTAVYASDISGETNGE